MQTSVNLFIILINVELAYCHDKKAKLLQLSWQVCQNFIKLNIVRYRMSQSIRELNTLKKNNFKKKSQMSVRSLDFDIVSNIVLFFILF